MELLSPSILQPWPTGRSWKAKLDSKTNDPNGKASHERPKSSRLVEASPEKSHEEDDGYRRAEQVGDGLDVVEQLRLLVAGDDRHPGDADQQQEEDEDPAHQQQLHLWGVLPDPRPDVHGEDGRGRVEDRGEGGHEGGHHHGQHQPTESGRHEVEDEEDEGDVRATALRLADLLALVRVGAAHLMIVMVMMMSK